jgi:ABC-type thiamine transport system substrate-binding protein
MKKAAVLALSLSLAVALSLSAQNKVVVYAALDTKTANDLAAAFKAKTGIDAELALQIEQAGTVASRIKTEADNPRADVVIGGNSNFHSDLAAGGLTSPYLSPVVRAGGDRQEVHGRPRLLDRLVLRRPLPPLQHEALSRPRSRRRGSRLLRPGTTS